MSLETADAILLTSHLRFAKNGGSISAAVATARREKSATVVTLTTASAHGLFVGASVVVAGVSGSLAASYNGTVTVLSVPTSTTFTYAEVTDTAAESDTADTGGTVTQTATVSSSIKPIAAASNWVNLGDVDEDPELDPGTESLIERIAPNQGNLVRHVRPARFGKPMVKYKLSQWNNFIVALAFCATPPATSATQFNPQSGVGAVMGWLKGMHLDEDNTTRIIYDLWGALRLTSAYKPGSRDFSRPELTFEVSFNTLNTVYAN